MINKAWFSDSEILEIRPKTNNEQITSRESVTLGFDQQEQSNRNEPPTSENKNTLSNKTKETLTQKQKTKFSTFKENYEWRKDYIAITKKHRMENK